MARYRDSGLDPKLYIGHLPRDASEKDLERAFRYYGPLWNVWVARNPPGFASVEFEDARDADDAVKALDGTTVCGVRISVEHSTSKELAKPRKRRCPPRIRRAYNPDDKCYECGERGHYAYDCTRAKHGGGGGARRRSRSRSRSWSSERSRGHSYSRSRSRSRSRTPKEQNTAENGSPTKRRKSDEPAPVEVKTEPEMSRQNEKTDVNDNIEVRPESEEVSSTSHGSSVRPKTEPIDNANLGEMSSNQSSNGRLPRDIPLCSLCVNQALYFCHQCKLKLCEDCGGKHNGYSVFLSHNPVPLSKIIFCHDHPPHTQIAFCFCNTCSEWICAECVINAHDGHHMESMSTVAITLRKDIEESQQITKQDVTKLDACLKQLENVKSSYKIKVTSRREKNKEMKVLASRLTSQLEHLEKCRKTTNKTLNKVKRQREQVIEDLATCTQFVEKCESLAKSDDMALFRTQQTQHPHELLHPRPQGDYDVSIPALQPISPQLTECVLGTIGNIRDQICDFRDENQGEDLIQLEVTQNMCDIIKTRSILYSKEKVIKDLPWTIGIMPGYKDKKKRLGIFLGCKGSPSGEWSCTASAKLTIRNQRDTDRDLTREIKHKFTSKSEPWGYNEFILWSRLFKPSRGYVKDGVIIIEARVSAKDPKIVQ